MLDKSVPGVVLICHADDVIDTDGLTAWIANTMHLAGVVLIRPRPIGLWKKIRREIRRTGLLRFLDVLAYRIHYRLFHAATDHRWKKNRAAALQAKYSPARSVPTLVTDHPDTESVRQFLRRLEPDMVIARCKFLLSAETFNIPRHGTFVLHPGICPEYRNAHGCFWALVNRDLSRVGMTLLRVNEGVDTGPVYLQAGCEFDELNESSVVIQYRVVIENLDAIAEKLIALFHDNCEPLPTAARHSAVWGQPWLSAYRKWKQAAKLEMDRKVTA